MTKDLLSVAWKTLAIRLQCHNSTFVGWKQRYFWFLDVRKLSRHNCQNFYFSLMGGKLQLACNVNANFDTTQPRCVRQIWTFIFFKIGVHYLVPCPLLTINKFTNSQSMEKNLSTPSVVGLPLKLSILLHSFNIIELPLKQVKLT